MTSSNRAIGIIRVSQREDGAQSPEKQARALLALADRSPWTLSPDDLWDENIDEDGHVRKTASGGAALEARPKFLAAIEAVERGEASVICAERLDRIFRDLDIQRAVVNRVEAAGGRIETLAGRTSHETAELELQTNLSGSVAQYVRRTAKERSMDAVTQAIEQGRIPWCQTAPGYTRNEAGTLEPDARKVPVIREAYRMRAEGATLAAVRAYLAKRGVKRSYHGTEHLLRDRIYVGEVHFGDRMNLAAHDPILDRELFERVQRVKVTRGRRAKSPRLLARLGVLRCATCGGRMVVGTQTQNGRSYPFYRCGHVREDCRERAAISGAMVEEAVVEAVKAAVAGEEGRASAEAGVREAELGAERAQEQLDAALRSFAAAGVMAEASAVERLGELRQARDSARERVEQVGGQRAAVTINAARDWDVLSYDARRALIRAVVERVTVRPGRGPDRIDIALVA
jgi:DNA invertase Pin-like site-specific DNA recombinase